MRMYGGPGDVRVETSPRVLWWEDQQPADMVEQAEKELLTGNRVSGNVVADAVDVDVLIRAPVLVLNLNYVPVNVCTVRRAIVLLTKGCLHFLVI